MAASVNKTEENKQTSFPIISYFLEDTDITDSLWVSRRWRVKYTGEIIE
jgi:hypothetical protein